MLGKRLALAPFGLLWVLLAAAPAVGQDPMLGEEDPVIEHLHDQTVPFLEGVSLGRAEAAFAELLVGSPLAQQTEAVNKLVSAARAIETRYGKYREFERIDARRVGEDLVLMKYLYKCDDFPVVWYFTYYRDFKHSDMTTENNEWMVIAVRFDTDLELLGF